MFYLQPLNSIPPKPDDPIFLNYKKIKNLDIQDSKFNNLIMDKIN